MLGQQLSVVRFWLNRPDLVEEIMLMQWYLDMERVNYHDYVVEDCTEGYTRSHVVPSLPLNLT